VALTGFEQYNEMVTKFERSKLFLGKFNEFIKIIKIHARSNPITSATIEQLLEIDGAQARKLTEHARAKGIRVGSGNKGYYYCKSREDTQDTISHLRERAHKLLWLASKLDYDSKKEDPQMRMAV